MEELFCVYFFLLILFFNVRCFQRYIDDRYYYYYDYEDEDDDDDGDEDDDNDDDDDGGDGL